MKRADFRVKFNDNNQEYIGIIVQINKAFTKEHDSVVIDIESIDGIEAKSDFYKIALLSEVKPYNEL